MTITPNAKEPITVFADYAASTPTDSEVLEAMRPYFDDCFANPSSIHSEGERAKKAISQARQTVATCLNTQPECIYFTGSGTESDNLAIIGTVRKLAKEETTKNKKHLITTMVEHSAVLEAFRYLERECGYEVTYLNPLPDGCVSVDALEAALRDDTLLVSVMLGNNEVGSLQPLTAMGELLREKNVLLHTDAVQVAGKLPIDLSTLPVDYLSLSGQKFYGPKGVGMLYVRAGSPVPEPLYFGGGQERKLRPGTEGLPQIVGFAKALELATARLPETSAHLRSLARYLRREVMANFPTSVVNTPEEDNKILPGILNVSFTGYEAEGLILKLDMQGVCVAAGSACSAGKVEGSRVLSAMGAPVEVAKSGLRFSFSRHNTLEDITHIVFALQSVVGTTSSTVATV